MARLRGASVAPVTDHSNQGPQPIDRTALLMGVAVGVPVTIAVGAVMAVFRSLFNTTNAALLLVIVALAVLGRPGVRLLPHRAISLTLDQPA